MNGSAALVVVLSVVGYLFLRHYCHRTSLRWDALEWQQNIFESTGVGLALFGVSRLGVSLLEMVPGPWQPLFHFVPAYLKRELSTPFAGSIVSAWVLGVLLAAASNKKWPLQQAQVLAIKHHGGSLRGLLMEAHLTRRAVMLTLSSRKVYVGWVFTPPLLRRPAYFVIFPTLSGYRGSDDLAVNWTTDYSSAYRDLMTRQENKEELATKPSHFQLVLPLEAVVSATYFDRDIYDRHFAPRPSADPDDHRPETGPPNLAG